MTRSITRLTIPHDGGIVSVDGAILPRLALEYAGDIHIWAETGVYPEPVDRELHIIADGDEIPDTWTRIATTVAADGTGIHLYEAPRQDPPA